MDHLVRYPGHELLLPDIVRAENCHLYDSEKRRYVDLESGVWCTSIGHGNRQVLEVLADQSARIGHTGFCYSSEIVEAAAQDLLSLLGWADGKCTFLCSGSEAIEYGVRVARSVADRPLFLTLADSYFGAYGSATTRNEDEWFSFDWMACSDCARCAEGDLGCEHWAAIPHDDIGGFLFEPGSSSGLVRFPPQKLIRNIVALIAANDGFVLVNEVTTGVGRTGAWFGYQHYGLRPDIVALGKGIGNGYPVSATALAPRVIERLGTAPVRYAQSHQNDPLGAAVVRKVIEVIRTEGLIERAQRISTLLSSGLLGIRDRTGKITDVRSRGLMAAVELKDDAQTSFTVRVHRELVRRGYVVGRRPGLNVLRLDPSLTIEESDIEGFLDALEAVLTDLNRDGAPS